MDSQGAPTSMRSMAQREGCILTQKKNADHYNCGNKLNNQGTL